MQISSHGEAKDLATLGAKSFCIAIAGNPNCGKTTLFNALTGLHYKVANYPGVTVEKKEGTIKLQEISNITVVDLPGIYTLSGTSIDETIALQALEGSLGNQSPDLIVSVVDASNLERNLFLTTQLIDLGIPVVIALNMTDVAERRGISIKREALSRQLDVPVVPIIASKEKGIDEVKKEIYNALKSTRHSSKQFAWLPLQCPYRQAAESVGIVEQENTKSQIPSLMLGSSILSESKISASPTTLFELSKVRSRLESEGIDGFSFEPTNRYRWINSIVKKSCVTQNQKQKTRTDRIDSIITHRFWGTIIFLLIMGFLFQSIFLWASYPMDIIDGAVSWLSQQIDSLLPNGDLNSLVVDGIVAGVGSVLIFIPQIAILFFMIGILEDSGYLSRAAFIMDRIMRRFGLQGRSFIPLLSSFACAIPGILSTRTIPSRGDRIATIMVAPLMSCSARIPVYTVLIGAFIPATSFLHLFSLQGFVLLGLYLLGIVLAALVAWALKLSILRGEPAIFVMEMPPYRFPNLKVILRDVYDRIILFLKSAGTVILACSIVLWFLASYPKDQSGATNVQTSFAGQIGTAMEPVIAPLGFNWEIGIGLLTSFAAREVFVSTLSTVYNLQDDGDGATSLVTTLRVKHQQGYFSLATGIALMVFYVFACQCMSTLAVCKRETGSWKWTTFMFGYMTILAYIVSFIAYHLVKILS